MPHLAALFAAGFLAVFFAALQSLLINTGHRRLATLNSFAIGLAQATVIAKLARPGTELTDALVYGASGACAINLALVVHGAVQQWAKR